MDKKEKKAISLRIKVFRVILLVAFLLILLISTGDIGLHIYSQLRYFHDESRHLMDFVMSLQDMDYIEKIFAETKEVYYSLPEEVRQDPFSDEFTEQFEALVDDDFFAARDILISCREKSGNRNMFLMFTDPELDAIVYVIDGDDIDWAYLPGQWLESDLEQLDRVAGSDWKLRLSHSDEYGWIGTDYKPVYAHDGSELGYIVLDVDMNDFFQRITTFLRIQIPSAVFVVLLIAFRASRLLKKNILDQVTGLSAAAKEYTARDKVAEIDSGTSFFNSLQIETKDELEDLWKSMADMEKDVNDTMRRLKTVTAEQEHLEAELSIAHQIQDGTLPHTFPAFPDRHEFEIYASMIPAREVGGDFYDFFLVDEDHLAMVIADVSGKGISAALFMINAKALLQNQTMISGGNVTEIFEKVNKKLIEQNEAMLFVTVWLGVLTISTGRVVYADAGHEFPAIRRKGKLFTIEKNVHSGPLAALPGMKFKAGEFILEPGDTLFTYTDGVTEANNREQEFFGKERLLESLNRDPDASPCELDENVRGDIAEFAGDVPQFDDITMLILKYYGSNEKS